MTTGGGNPADPALFWFRLLLPFRILVVVGALLVASPVARALDVQGVSIDDAALSDLARNPQWLALLHLHSQWWRTDPDHPQVQTSAFYLSRPVSADAEMRADLVAFFMPASGSDDAHPLCRFPARYAWLKQHLPLPVPAFDPQRCNAYRAWRDDVNAASVTLVFASSYLNSPSSMFGHTFLRIDPPGGYGDEAPLLARVVNFGAVFDPSDNSVMYAWRGIFGGYGGNFNMMPYYDKVKEYNHAENRDLWEYSLNLTPPEVDRLMAHLWELDHITLDYFFFDQNCSYRQLELLEIARPGAHLVDEFGVHAIPLDTVRTVQRAGWVADVVYRPSRVARIEHVAAALDGNDRDLALALANGQALLDSPEVMNYSPAARRQLLLLAYEHLRYQQDQIKRDAAMARRSFDLLQAIARLPGADVPVRKPVAPDAGQHSQLLAVGGGDTDAGDAGQTLEYRASYHDLADNEHGYLRGAAITLGDIRLRHLEGEAVRLDALTLVSIQSHAPQTDLFEHLSWRVRGGFERFSAAYDEPLSGVLQGGAGLTWRLGEAGPLPYLLAIARAEHTPGHHPDVLGGAGATGGMLWYLPWGVIQAEAEGIRMADGSERDTVRLTQSLLLGVDDAIRLDVARTGDSRRWANGVDVSLRHAF